MSCISFKYVDLLVLTLSLATYGCVLRYQHGWLENNGQKKRVPSSGALAYEIVGWPYNVSLYVQ
jgi:hypothetical protein